jgi:hypothetical protein
MRAELRAEPLVIEIFGPPLTQQLIYEVRSSVAKTLGIDLSADDISKLHRTIESLAFSPLQSPADAAAKAAVVDLVSAIKRLRTAAGGLRAQYLRGILPGRDNIAMRLWCDDGLFDEEHFVQNPSTKDLVRGMVQNAEFLEKRAKRILKGARPIQRGKGRSIEGYDKFVRACRLVWERHRTDQGWSKKEGRGTGPFVTFVYLAQPLLPPRMRRKSCAAAGDAVIDEMMKGTNSKKVSVS